MRSAERKRCLHESTERANHHFALTPRMLSLFPADERAYLECIQSRLVCDKLMSGGVWSREDASLLSKISFIPGISMYDNGHEVRPRKVEGNNPPTNAIPNGRRKQRWSWNMCSHLFLLLFGFAWFPLDLSVLADSIYAVYTISAIFQLLHFAAWTGNGLGFVQIGVFSR